MTQKADLILFVCTGNTCRSPIARGYFESEVKKRGLSLAAESAGISVVHSYPASQEAIEVLKEEKIDLSSHQSKKVSDELVKTARAVYAMTKGHAEVLQMMYPEYKNKIFTLSEKDIADPYGGSLFAYRHAAAEIKEAVLKIVGELCKA